MVIRQAGTNIGNTGWPSPSINEEGCMGSCPRQRAGTETVSPGASLYYSLRLIYSPPATTVGRAAVPRNAMRASVSSDRRVQGGPRPDTVSAPQTLTHVSIRLRARAVHHEQRVAAGQETGVGVIRRVVSEPLG
jgi:hypothetical protein